MQDPARKKHAPEPCNHQPVGRLKLEQDQQHQSDWRGLTQVAVGANAQQKRAVAAIEQVDAGLPAPLHDKRRQCAIQQGTQANDDGGNSKRSNGRILRNALQFTYLAGWTAPSRWRDKAAS